MAVAVIADAHLGGPGGPPEPLIEQLEELRPESCERLVLLGDLFQIWIGFERYETPEIRSVVKALKRVRDRGILVHYIEGNRDFYLGGRRYRDAFDSVGSHMAFEVDNRKFLAVHGDGLNDRDYQYRIWRFLSKNPLSRLAMRGFPQAIARPLVYRAEHGLAKTNFKHKAAVPETVIKRFAERRLAQGFDTLLLGHFHQPRSWQVSGGRVELLDAWFRSHRVEWFPAVSTANTGG